MQRPSAPPQASVSEDVVAVLLAGGLARRLGGGDKPLRLVGGRRLLDRAIERVAPQVRALALNANGAPARFADCGLPVVADTLPGALGPLAGILAGMRWAASAHPGCATLLSVPADTPFLPRDLASRLLRARAESGLRAACAVSAGRVHPVVALWPVAAADCLEAELRAGGRRVGAWAERLGVAYAEFAVENGDPFFNVNTPAELAAAEAMLAPRN